MAQVRYIGLSGVRQFTKADFTGVGVEDQGKVRFPGKNLHNPSLEGFKGKWEDGVEVSDAAATYLVENEGTTVDGDFTPDFEYVGETPEPVVEEDDEPEDEGISDGWTPPSV